jgi:hypothetical protein
MRDTPAEKERELAAPLELERHSAAIGNAEGNLKEPNFPPLTRSDPWRVADGPELAR